MFKKGELIIYGSNGVCEIVNVGSMDAPGVAKDKLYYTLIPVYSKDSKIYTPVNNDKVVMRPVISKTAALKLIDEIKQVDTLFITDEKNRDKVYKEAFEKCDCMELVKIIKTINLRQSARIKEGKKITSGDEKYIKTAEDRLYGELAIPLHIQKDEVKEYISKRIDHVSSDMNS